MAKDLFSAQAFMYSKYRPIYPKELYEYIISFVNERNLAWDCATGNGQAASVLADDFKEVFATDISEAQLQNAILKKNIKYEISPAEKTPFDDNSFDLITVATAYHWLKWDQFYAEATRVGKNNCVVAIWTYYTLTTSDEQLNILYNHFYHNITSGYWEYERRYVDEQYESVIFDFNPLPAKQFFSIMQWTKDDFKGYLESWSAVQKYIKQNNTSPLLLIEKELDVIWASDQVKEIVFPISLRLGRIRK
jgi:ubiquinone/menaquinone biosynthesis C-methylase UbiE